MGMFDLEGFDKPSKKELREDRAKEFNQAQRAITRAVGENMASLGAILIVLLFVGYIWTDFSFQIEWQKAIIDAIVTIVFFILMESLWVQNGIKCGKLDEEYVAAHEKYIEMRDTVLGMGVSLMDKFCAWQIDEEYDTYLRKRCKSLKIEYSDYVESLSNLSLKELEGICGADIAAKVFALKQIKPIELSREILMTDGSNATERGGVGESGQEYAKKKTIGWLNLALTFASGAGTAWIAVAMNGGASWALVVYTLVKLSFLCWRMYKGYSSGAKAYNTVEVKHLQDKMLYLNMYIEFIKKKTYLSLGDKYGEIIVAEEVEENKPSL